MAFRDPRDLDWVIARLTAYPDAWRQWQATVAHRDPTVWLVRDPEAMVRVLATAWRTARGGDRAAIHRLMATVGAVAALPYPQSRIIPWREWDGWPVQRIADRLYLSPRHVYRLREQGLRQLARWWACERPIRATPHRAVEQALWDL